MAKQAPPLEFEGVESEPKRPVLVGRKPSGPVEYTRCWRLSHPAFGGLQVKCDTADEAVQAFLDKKAPGLSAERVKADLLCREIPFTPAETEVGKPGGWVKGRAKLVHSA